MYWPNSNNCAGSPSFQIASSTPATCDPFNNQLSFNFGCSFAVAFPVTWSYVSASKQGSSSSITQKVNVQWGTSSELNNMGFHVQRSMNASSWSNISSLISSNAGGGTTNNPQNYTYTDNTPPMGTVYYRVKQTDYNGSSDYSSIRQVNCNDCLRSWPSSYVGSYLYFSASISGTLKTEFQKTKWWQSRQRKTYSINNSTQVNVSNLKNGQHKATLTLNNGVTKVWYFNKS